MSNAPTCRNCVHGIWQPSKNGLQIARGTHGTCSKATELRMKAPGSPSPCYRVAQTPTVIWPTDKAGRCPGFAVKGGAE